MKRKFLTMLCTTALILSMNGSIICHAAIENTTATNNVIEGKIKTSDDENTKSSKYSFKDFNDMTDEELIDCISKIKWSDVSDLFEYNDETYKFYSNQSRIDSLINALEEKSKEFTSDDDKGIDTIVEFLRSAFYLGYYNDSLSYLNNRALHDRCIPALLNMANNVNFRLGEEAQTKVVRAYGKLIGNASCNAEVINKTIPILNQYYDDITGDSEADRTASDAVQSIISKVAYDLEQYCYETKTSDYTTTPWYGKIDGFIDCVSKFATLTNLDSDFDWLVNNGIYYTADLAKYSTKKTELQKLIEKGLTLFPKHSEQYLTVVDSISSKLDNTLSDGTKLDTKKLLDESRDEYLPKTYKFDDGKIIIKTGDKVSENKVQRLYWASKEVKSQFHRVVGNDTPVDTTGTDDVLTMVIYNSPKEYKLNRIFYGYSVDNGGMYIESVGTFFTYERTPQESIYTLEELFRHEFTHYLQGRFLVPGLFGQGDFYKDNDSRLTWFEEGSAEFFAGSTRETVIPRKSVISGIVNNQDRFSINKLFHSGYSSGWEFYTYGSTFSDYMYHDNKDLFSRLTKDIMANDVKSYDSLIEYCSNNQNLNYQYQDHMDELVENFDNCKNPSVSNDYMIKCSPNTLNNVQADIQSVIPLETSTIEKEKSQYFDTYTLKGKYKLGTDNGEINNWNLMNDRINQAITDLSNLSWQGYKTVTAYFTNPQINNNNEVEYDVTFHGVLAFNDTFIGEPSIHANVPKSGDIFSKLKFKATCMSEHKNLSYNWDFGDGTTSSDPECNHVYNKSGEYEVKLTVKDTNDFNAEYLYNVNINPNISGNPVFETTDTSNLQTAQEIKFNDLVEGSLNGLDAIDIFTFEIDKPTELNVYSECNSESDVRFIWRICPIDKLDDMISYGTANHKNVAENVTNLKEAGKYVLVVSKVNNSDADYKLLLRDTSNINSDENINPNDDENNSDQKHDVLKETECNDGFENSNVIEKNKTISGTLNNNDRRDTFCFETNKSGKVDISLEDLSNKLCKSNFVVYSEDDTENILARDKANGNKLELSFDAPKAGKYYIVVYNSEQECSVDYNLTVDGVLKDSSTNTSDDSTNEANDNNNDNTTIDNNNNENNSEQKTDLLQETECNDGFENSNIIEKNKTISGTLNNNDKRDTFSFETKQNEKIDINLEDLSNKLCKSNFVVYSEDDTRTVLARSKTDKNELSATFEAPKAGKYYVLVYNSENECSVDYNLTVNGDSKQSSNTATSDDDTTVNTDINDDDTFNNSDDDSFEVASKIKLNSTIKDSLIGSDSRDTYVFELKEPKKINVQLKDLDNIDVSWQLFSKDDLKNPILFGNASTDFSENNQTLDANKYYLIVYKYKNIDGKYILNLK